MSNNLNLFIYFHDNDQLFSVEYLFPIFAGCWHFPFFTKFGSTFIGLYIIWNFSFDFFKPSKNFRIGRKVKVLSCQSSPKWKIRLLNFSQFHTSKLENIFGPNCQNPKITEKEPYVPHVMSEINFITCIYHLHMYTVTIISSFVYVMFYSIIKRDIPDTNTGYKLNIY